MREQLIQYVNLLFAGAHDSDDIRQEILQNTLDRYDDLVSQGKSPEAAYRLAISGIGDVNEILGNPVSTRQSKTNQTYREPIADDREHRKIKAVAIGMYILCPVPLFILSDLGLATMGLCFTLLLVAAATALLVMNKGNEPEERAEVYTDSSSKSQLKKSIANLIRVISLALFLIVSIMTGAWFTTWLIFPIAACVRGLVYAIIDLKEVNDNET